MGRKRYKKEGLKGGIISTRMQGRDAMKSRDEEHEKLARKVLEIKEISRLKVE